MVELSRLKTPALLLDEDVMLRNIARMDAHLAPHGIDLRPHLKTCKSAEIAKTMTANHSGAVTVSTLAEAAYFLDNGFTDILYAVGIVPNKLDEVATLNARGGDVKIILDHPQTAQMVAQWSTNRKTPLSVLLEVDTDGHRAGLLPDDPDLIATARLLADAPQLRFKGVMTHAGASYDCRSAAALHAMATQERTRIVAAAKALKDAGMPCEIVSLGSTPTALFGADFSDVSEVRAGVYVFFDLFQEGLGVCAMDDIAASVLCRVISHNPRHNRLIVDAGGLALSKDRGTASLPVDRGYGLLAEMGGKALPHMVVEGVNQEHGLVTTADGSPIDFDRFPISSLWRVLPNHVCMTAAAYDVYHVLNDDGNGTGRTISRINGW